MSNKSSFGEHKAAGTLGLAADTRAGGIRESGLLCGAEAPSLETESWLGAKSSSGRTPYLNKGRARSGQCYHRRATGSERGGLGGHCVGGFVLRFFFFPPLWLLFSFLSIQLCSIQQPGAWQNLAAIPTRPFPVQTAPVNFYKPALKLQARLLLPASGYLFALPVWPHIFSRVCYPRSGYNFPPALKTPVTSQPAGEPGGVRRVTVSGSCPGSCHFHLPSACFDPKEEEDSPL